MHGSEGISVFNSPLLAERTSIRLGGTAIAEVRVSHPRGFERLPEVLAGIGGHVRLLGEGSNVLAMDGELPLVLVSQACLSHAEIVAESDGKFLLRASAGMRLPALLAKAASLGLAGLEGLTGIPGSVGGAIMMNAGSFGIEIGKLVHSVEFFSPLLGIVERRADEFVFSYRSCKCIGPMSGALPEAHDGFLVTAVTLALAGNTPESIRAAMRDVYLKKRMTQPVTAKSAGCVFKNPAPDVPAGRLLEEAGLKGVFVGKMGFSSLHANFLVNEGGGTSGQAMELIALAKEKVQRRSGHALELEVRVWL